jgi:hypothetical protein
MVVFVGASSAGERTALAGCVASPLLWELANTSDQFQVSIASRWLIVIGVLQQEAHVPLA